MMTRADDDGPCVYALGECFGCHQLFSFNPHRVPSVVVHGEREPICEACVARVNPRRIANGLDPIVPLPGAYEPEPL
jgi:hypothetical protein